MDGRGHPGEERPDAAADPRSLGQRGEAHAARYLERRLGLEVVARNWRLTSGELRGELDLIALDHARGTVVVVEVKTRVGTGSGGPLAAIGYRKQTQIRRLATVLLASGELPYRRVRFDAIGIAVVDGRPRLSHVEGAF